MKLSSKDGGKVMTVIASPGQGPDRSTEVSYTDTKVCLEKFFDLPCLKKREYSLVIFFNEKFACGYYFFKKSVEIFDWHIFSLTGYW